MTWSFRRLLNRAPLNADISHSGVGGPANVRGTREVPRSPGTFVSLGPKGFQYLEIPGQLGAQTVRDQLTALAGPSGFIHSASVSELALRAPETVIQDIQQRLRRPNLFAWYVAASLLLGLYASAAHPALGIACIILAAIPAMRIYTWNRARRTTNLLYDINDMMIVERLAIANAAGQALSQATRIWHIFYAERTSDWKRNAGAKTLIQRTPTRAAAGSLPQIGLNIEPWCVPVGPQKLLFLPDRLFVWDGSRLVGLPYEDLSIRAESTRFIEDESVPSDARQVDTTWRYVNKKGGPDRRFTNNKQLPVLEYGKIELTSASGLRVVLQTSTPEAAAGVERALSALARYVPARPVSRATGFVRPASATPARQHATIAPDHPHPLIAPTSQSAPGRNDADATTVRSVAILLRYIASADRRITDEEVAFALAVLSDMNTVSPIAADGFDSWFRALPADTNSIDAAISTVQTLGEEGCRWVVGMVVQMAGADGRATPKEIERRRELEHRLGLQILPTTA